MKNLQKIREKKVMSREKLAGEVGCSFNSIRDYESGKTSPSADIAYRIAKTLDVTMEELMEGE